ncbi:MAG: phosphotransferase [Gammaproteobacteria bacterium]
MAERLEQLTRWLREDIGITQFDIAPASSDASFRRYFRIRYSEDGAQQTRVVMDAPPAQEDCAPYVQIAREFLALGLNVPEIIRADMERGFLLLSDLGPRQYLDELNESSVEDLYGAALEALLILQLLCKTDEIRLPPYDHALLMREMGLFGEWFVHKHLGITLTDDQSAQLTQICELLAASALEQPTVCVHRDYHSRNLMITQNNNPGILDFQDAVAGPLTYDLVSLLRDCYIAWPPAQVREWAIHYQRRALEAGLLTENNEAQFMRWFDWMGIQRHLKAIGIFARLSMRDGKPGYLKDIPRTLGYVVAVSRHYPELAPLNILLRDVIVPALANKAA